MHTAASSSAHLPFKSPHTWAEFACHLSSPSAQYHELAQLLTRSGLSFPGSSCDASQQQSDLNFFAIVRYAFHRGRLRAFLTFMRLAKREPYWDALRNCRETQSIVIDVFLRDSLASIYDAIRLLPLWIYEANQFDEAKPIARFDNDRASPKICSSGRANPNLPLTSTTTLRGVNGYVGFAR